MAKHSRNLNLFQSVVFKVSSTRAGSWLFARVLHHLDGPFLRRFGGWCPSMTLGGVREVALVTTTGAKSGKKRSVPLIALEGASGELAVSGTNWGQSRHPGWYHNMKANPEVEIQADGRVRRFLAREASDVERDGFLDPNDPLAGLMSTYEEYAGNRKVPMMILQPVERNSMSDTDVNQDSRVE